IRRRCHPRPPQLWTRLKARRSAAGWPRRVTSTKIPYLTYSSGHSARRRAARRMLSAEKLTHCCTPFVPRGRKRVRGSGGRSALSAISLAIRFLSSSLVLLRKKAMVASLCSMAKTAEYCTPSFPRLVRKRAHLAGRLPEPATSITTEFRTFLLVRRTRPWDRSPYKGECMRLVAAAKSSSSRWTTPHHAWGKASAGRSRQGAITTATGYQTYSLVHRIKT